MRVTKKLFASVALLSVLTFGVTSCGILPKPFEQDVPHTVITVDEDGKKTKTTIGASNAKTEPQKVVSVINDFYAEIHNGENLEVYSKDLKATKLSGLLEQSIKTGQEPELSDAEMEEAVNEIDALIENHPHYFEHLDFSNADDETRLAAVFFMVFVAGMMQGIQVEYPVQAVTVTSENTAVVDVSDMIVKDNEGKVIEATHISGTDEDIPMVKIDGEWKIGGKDFLDPSTEVDF